ncbi:MAG: DnaD domain protein [Lachnospiraceae bacterium]|nr:DnaD domain protein [Lachnospiraceae bacterium]
MGNITLCKDYSSEVTLVRNDFIDKYMAEANDAQIKVYLYLLRQLGAGSGISVSDMADRFNYTERDVVRALRYWDTRKLVSLSFTTGGELTGIKMLDISEEKPGKAQKSADGSLRMLDISEEKPGKEQKSADAGLRMLDAGDEKPGKTQKASDGSLRILDVSEEEPVNVQKAAEGNIKMVDFSRKREYSADELLSFREKPEISQLLFITETYLNKTLRPDEISSILFMYDSYGFSADLIEYLIEYCANNRKKSMKYIESVARSWAETGISCVEEAKARTCTVPKDVYTVFKAFGISGRSPIEPEISYVVKWKDVYGFSIDIICEACSRTIMNIHSVSFEYADTILTNWKDSDVKSLDDIIRLDSQRAKKEGASGSRKAEKQPVKQVKDGSFNSFSQRKYDYAELEKDALYNQG